MLREAPSYAASVTDSLMLYFFTSFPPQRQSLGAIFVLGALNVLKGSCQLSGVAALDLIHHHCQISREEPHPWALEEGKVPALVRH